MAKKPNVGILQETIFKWEKMSVKKQIKKKRKWSVGGNKKGCMKGKGGPKNLSHRFRGVRQRIWGKWVAEIREPKCNELVDYVPKRLWLGTFGNEVDAAKAYDQAAKAIYGDVAILNFPESSGECGDNVGGLREGSDEIKEEKVDGVETEKVSKGGVVECVKKEEFDGIDEKDDMRFRDFRAEVEGLREEILMDVKGVEDAKNLDFDLDDDEECVKKEKFDGIDGKDDMRFRGFRDGVEGLREEILIDVKGVEGAKNLDFDLDGEEECVKEEKVDAVDAKDDMRFRDFRAGVEGLREQILMDVKGVEGAKNLDFDLDGGEECVNEEKVDAVDGKDDMRFRDFWAGKEGLREEILIDVKGGEGAKNLDFDFYFDGGEECVKEEKVDAVDGKDDMRFRDFRAGVEGLKEEILIDVKGVEGAKNLDLGFLGEFLMKDFDGSQDLEHFRNGDYGNCEDLRQERVSDHNRTVEISDGNQNLLTGESNYVGQVKNVVSNDETDESRGLRKLVCADGSQNSLEGNTDFIGEFKKLNFTDKINESRNMLMNGDPDYKEFKEPVCTDEIDKSRILRAEDGDYISEIEKLLCPNETDESRTGFIKEPKKVGSADESKEQQDGDIDHSHLDWCNNDPLKYIERPLGYPYYSNSDDEPEIYIASLWSE